MEKENITAYAFERNCGIANGYLKKQFRGKGALGSKILDKIHVGYPDLNTVWLLTGEGEMMISQAKTSDEDEKYLTIKDEMIELLRNQISLMKKSLDDKDKIIRFLEDMVEEKKKKQSPQSR